MNPRPPDIPPSAGSRRGARGYESGALTSLSYPGTDPGLRWVGKIKVRRDGPWAATFM